MRNKQKDLPQISHIWTFWEGGEVEKLGIICAWYVKVVSLKDTDNFQYYILMPISASLVNQETNKVLAGVSYSVVMVWVRV